MFILKKLVNQPTFGIKRSYLKRQDLLSKKEDNTFSSRLKTLLAILFLLIKFLFKAQKTNATHLIIDPYISNEKAQMRFDFIQFFNPNITQNNLVLTNHRRLYFKKWTFSIFLKFVSIWMKFSATAFQNLFINGKYPTQYLYYVAANSLQFQLLQPQKTYIFQLYDTSVYLSALLLQEKNTEVYIPVSNAIMFAHSRYTHLDKSHFILSIPYQKEEISYYQNCGWVKAKSVELWGPEEIVEHNVVPKQVPQIDIGLYSAGFWARNGLNRERNIDAIKSYQHANNPGYLTFLEILNAVIEFQKKNPVSVKIYTHPMERDWFHKHQIKPPYWQLAQENNIEIDLSAGNSLSKLYEVKIGIGTMTTVLLDRWHHQLDSLIYYRKDVDKHFFQPKYLGSYGENCFERFDEMEELIVRLL